jgi:diadenosine tetraphosphatase ApaH/serine/threonine PP2A family protein phosphatase
VCLGDALQGGSQPAAVVRLLREHAWPIVLGNADDFVRDANAGEEVPTERQLYVRAWTREQLGDDGLAFIETFEPTIRLELGEGRTLLAFHGSPASYDDVILPTAAEDEFTRLLGPPVADVLTGGHIHRQWLRRYGDSVFVNPGSVGLAYDHVQLEHAVEDLRTDPFAEYARIDIDRNRFEIAFRRVPFDRDAVLEAIDASGMPHADAARKQWRLRTDS